MWINSWVATDEKNNAMEEKQIQTKRNINFKVYQGVKKIQGDGTTDEYEFLDYKESPTLNIMLLSKKKMIVADIQTTTP